jgi:hypothetical protein
MYEYKCMYILQWITSPRQRGNVLTMLETTPNQLRNMQTLGIMNQVIIFNHNSYVETN